MTDLVEPSFDFEREPVAVGAAVLFAVCTVALLGFGRPGWLFPASILAGLVAAWRSDFYGNTATNGLVAVAAGIVLLLPVLVAFRAEWLTHFGAAGNSREEWAFLGATGAMADLVIRGPLMLLFGFITGGVASFFESRDADGPRRLGGDES